jgi:hypothetical protein
MNRIACKYVLPLLGIACFAVAGCSASNPPAAPSASAPAKDDHDHDHDPMAGKHSDHKHDHGAGHAAEDEPASYADAVQKVDALCGATKDAFAAKDMEKADIPVHKLGHVLEDIPELAAKESLSAEDQEAIKKAVEELFDCFGKIDDKLHGNEGKSYDEVAARIDAALQTLRSKLKPREN